MTLVWKEAERENRAKIIAAQGEALAAGGLGRAADVMRDDPNGGARTALRCPRLTRSAAGANERGTVVDHPTPAQRGRP